MNTKTHTVTRKQYSRLFTWIYDNGKFARLWRDLNTGKMVEEYNVFGQMWKIERDSTGLVVAIMNGEHVWTCSESHTNRYNSPDRAEGE